MAMTETVTATDNVHIRVFDTDELIEGRGRAFIESLPPESRAQLVASECEIIQEYRTSNTTCIGLYDTLVDLLDPAQSDRIPVDSLGVGTGNVTPTRTDTAVANELGRLNLSDVTDNGPELYVRAFVSSFEFNGETLTNVGLYSSDSRLLNHSNISSITKTQSRAVTIEVSISFNDVNA